jgi:large subunit ribosomal protein L15
MTQRLNNLQNRPGAKRRVKRYGCGESSGHGKTCGRGGKGQTARSGGGIRPGFEGGQMPLIRRMPKRGFNNSAHRTEFSIVKLDMLEQFDNGATVTPELLAQYGWVSRKTAGVKILGGGKLTKKLTVRAHRFSAGARQAIEAAGGACEMLPINPRASASAPSTS